MADLSSHCQHPHQHHTSRLHVLGRWHSWTRRHHHACSCHMQACTQLRWRLYLCLDSRVLGACEQMPLQPCATRKLTVLELHVS
jgi:hypothetical protein